MTVARPRVVIVQRYVTHYRVPFYELLRELLAARDVELHLVHGFPESDDKQDTAAISWATHMENRWLDVKDTRLLWEPALDEVEDADLVIVEQASSRLLNYVLFARQLRGRTRMAFWGHGRNFKAARASTVGEAVKRAMTRRVHWWFAYNRRSADVVAATGFPRDRITDVQNAIDTRELVAARAALSEADVADIRRDLGLPERHVAAFVGGMYREKQLPFLIDAARVVREHVPDFTLLLAGAGPDAALAQEAAAREPWIRYLGPRRGDDKVAILAVSELLLLPGAVGLAVLDAFALEVPLVTVDGDAHGPELAYLESGANGLVLPVGTTPAGYAGEVVRLLGDDTERARLAAGCRAARERYTIEEMVRRFADGVVAALAAP